MPVPTLPSTKLAGKTWTFLFVIGAITSLSIKSSAKLTGEKLLSVLSVNSKDLSAKNTEDAVFLAEYPASMFNFG